jgi:hypothetical protein
MPLWQWTKRTFSFDFPTTKFFDLLERLRGTPARIEERVKGIPPDILIRRPAEGGWSIQENIGHLLDLGYLPRARIEQILRGETLLIGADMENRKTHEAGHNRKSIESLLAEFRRERGGLIARLESLNPEDLGKSALHPRLRQPMRIVDIVCFDAEHDDYHLARIAELLRMFSGETSNSPQATGNP